MGVLLYALLCGSFPFRGQNDRDLYRKIVRGVFHIADFVGEGAKSMVQRALTTDMLRQAMACAQIKPKELVYTGFGPRNRGVRRVFGHFGAMFGLPGGPRWMTYSATPGSRLIERRRTRTRATGT